MLARGKDLPLCVIVLCYSSVRTCNGLIFLWLGGTLCHKGYIIPKSIFGGRSCIWLDIALCLLKEITTPSSDIKKTLSLALNTAAIRRCLKPFSQWQCSFYLKAALPLLKRPTTASNRSENIVLLAGSPKIVITLGEASKVYFEIIYIYIYRYMTSGIQVWLTYKIYWNPVDN